MANDLANQIYEERMQISFDMLNRFCEKNKIKLTDFEKTDISTRIASSLFIEKNKSYRASQINR